MEYKKRCRTCGKIFCYTDDDLARNKSNKQLQNMAALSTIFNAIGGTMYGAVESDKMADRAASKIVDYDKCPYCGSTDLYLLDDQEIKRLEKEERAKSINISGGGDPVALLKRAELFLEDGEWAMADAYAENALNGDPENPLGYLYKLMAEKEVNTVDKLVDLSEELSGEPLYKKAIRFGDSNLKEKLEAINKEITERNEYNSHLNVYEQAVSEMNKAESEEEYIKAAEKFKDLDFKDSETLYFKSLENAEICRKDAIYNSGVSKMVGKAVSNYETAIKTLSAISGWKDSDELINECRQKIEEIRVRNTATAKHRKKTLSIVLPGLVLIAVLAVICVKVIMPNAKYNSAISLYESGKYEEAIAAFEAMDGYKDSAEQIEICNTAITEREYKKALDLYNAGEYEEAIESFKALNGYKDSAAQIIKCENSIQDAEYKAAIELYESNQFSSAIMVFNKIKDYKDSAKYVQLCAIAQYSELFESKLYDQAVNAAKTIDISSLPDAERTGFQKKLYEDAEKLEASKDYSNAFALYELSQINEYSKRMESCNKAYIKTPKTISNSGRKTRGEINGYEINNVTALYQSGKFVFTIYYSASVKGEWWLSKMYGDNTGTGLFLGTISMGESSFSYTIPAADALSENGKTILSWDLSMEDGLGHTGSSWQIGNKGIFDYIQKDLYGNKIQ